MKFAPHWIATAIGLIAWCTSMLAQEDDDFLFPVRFDLYLKKESPLYPFAIGHPCGKTVTLRANVIPVKVSMVQTVWAYELAPNGKVETRWALPVDGTPLAVDGDRLTIHQFNDEDVVFVTAGFGIGTSLTGPDRAALENEYKNRVECPSGTDDLELIRSHLCSEVTDASTGKVRIIAYPPVCT